MYFSVPWSRHWHVNTGMLKTLRNCPVQLRERSWDTKSIKIWGLESSWPRQSRAASPADAVAFGVAGTATAVAEWSGLGCTCRNSADAGTPGSTNTQQLGPRSVWRFRCAEWWLRVRFTWTHLIHGYSWHNAWEATTWLLPSLFRCRWCRQDHAMFPRGWLPTGACQEVSFDLRRERRQLCSTGCYPKISKAWRAWS